MNQMGAAELVKQLRARTEAVERAVAGRPPVSVFFQLSGQPLYTAGKTSFVTNLIERAGGRSVTADVNECLAAIERRSGARIATGSDNHAFRSDGSHGQCSGGNCAQKFAGG